MRSTDIIQNWFVIFVNKNNRLLLSGRQCTNELPEHFARLCRIQSDMVVLGTFLNESAQAVPCFFQPVKAPTVEIKMDDRIRFPVVFFLRDRQAVEQLPASFKDRLESGDRQRLSETTGT